MALCGGKDTDMMSFFLMNYVIHISSQSLNIARNQQNRKRSLWISNEVIMTDDIHNRLESHNNEIDQLVENAVDVDKLCDDDKNLPD